MTNFPQRIFCSSKGIAAILVIACMNSIAESDTSKGASAKSGLKEDYPAPVIQHALWYSRKESGERPSASLDVQTRKLTIHPIKVSFTIPQSGQFNQQYHVSGDIDVRLFHLTRDELESVARGTGEWATEYASVTNAVMPFDRCVAHIGDAGERFQRKSGFQVRSVFEIQTRIYDVSDTLNDVERRIAHEGAADIKRFTGKDATVTQDLKSKWRKTMLSYNVFYGDYGGVANVDFRIRTLKGHTVVVVFMYEGSGQWDASRWNRWLTPPQLIDEILNSFAASAG